MYRYAQYLRLVIVGKEYSTTVSEVLWRLAWLSVLCCVVGYVSYLYFGSFRATPRNGPSVLITDEIKPAGEHHLSGIIPVPTPCHGLSVRTQEINLDHYRLDFTTWQEPARTCEPHEQTRNFSTVVFAPAVGVTFSATLDGEDIDLHVYTRR